MDFRNVTSLFADPDFDGDPVQIYAPGEDDPVTSEDDGEEEIIVDDDGEEIIIDPPEVEGGGERIRGDQEVSYKNIMFVIDIANRNKIKMILAVKGM